VLIDRGILYEGLHENKTGKDTELLVIRSQEDYAELVKLVQNIVVNNNAAAPPLEIAEHPSVRLPVEVLLSIERTKRLEARVRMAEAEASKKKAEIEFEMLKFRVAHGMA